MGTVGAPGCTWWELVQCLNKNFCRRASRISVIRKHRVLSGTIFIELAHWTGQATSHRTWQSQIATCIYHTWNVLGTPTQGWDHPICLLLWNWHVGLSWFFWPLRLISAKQKLSINTDSSTSLSFKQFKCTGCWWAGKLNASVTLTSIWVSLGCNGVFRRAQQYNCSSVTWVAEVGFHVRF